MADVRIPVKITFIFWVLKKNFLRRRLSKRVEGRRQTSPIFSRGRVGVGRGILKGWVGVRRWMGVGGFLKRCGGKGNFEGKDGQRGGWG